MNHSTIENKKRYIFGFLTDSIGLTARDQQGSNGNSGMTAAATTTTATTDKTDHKMNRSSWDSNLKTLIEFKKNLIIKYKRQKRA